MTVANDLWPIQLALIEEIAAQPNASIEKLHFSFMEEIGHAPGIEHIDCFAGMVDIPDDEVLQYLKYIGRPKPERKNGTRVGGRKRARSIVSDDSVDVPQFCKVFAQEYGRAPVEEFVQYYQAKVKKVKKGSCVNVPLQGAKNGFTFVDKVALDPHATVLKFRRKFYDEFGVVPSEELIQYFLDRSQAGGRKKVDLSKPIRAELHFAETGADGSLKTVLEFRKGFKATFGREPDDEVTKVFIAGLAERR